MDQYCRLCGSEDGIKVNIFEPDKEYVKKIHRILPITVNEYDPLPKSMCHRCSFKVNDFYQFRITCIRSQEIFKSKLPWMKNRTNLALNNNNVNQPPMVELPLNSINYISPSERNISEEFTIVDENDSLIVIDDDSPPYTESKSTSIQKNNIPQEKIIMKIKRSELKKRTRPKSIWDSKKRRRRTYNSCRITEVFTTTVDEYDMIGNIENDPLSNSPEQINQNTKNNQVVLDVSDKTEKDTVKGNLSTKNSGDSIELPNYILVTDIPREGSVYTCEKCRRTFLCRQLARLHTCHDVISSTKDTKHKDEDRDTSSNSTDFYSCNECNQLFSRQSQLIAHKKKHYEAVSSSDDKALPVNRRRKRRRKSKANSQMYKTGNQIETGIIRHSLLSSDSD